MAEARKQFQVEFNLGQSFKKQSPGRGLTVATTTEIVHV
jgi:hypothetical protein